MWGLDYAANRVTYGIGLPIPPNFPMVTGGQLTAFEVSRRAPLPQVAYLPCVRTRPGPQYAEQAVRPVRAPRRGATGVAWNQPCSGGTA